MFLNISSNLHSEKWKKNRFCSKRGVDIRTIRTQKVNLLKQKTENIEQNKGVKAIKNCKH